MFASGVNSAYSPTPWGFLNIFLSYLELRSKPRFLIPVYQSIFKISSRRTLTFRDFENQILFARVLERKSEILGKSSDNPGKRLKNRRIYGCSSNPKPVGSYQFQFSLEKCFGITRVSWTTVTSSLILMNLVNSTCVKNINYLPSVSAWDIGVRKYRTLPKHGKKA